MSDALLGLFDLDAEIDRLKPDKADQAGRRAETLIKNDALRVVLVTMRTDITLQNHSAPGPITIHVLRGRFNVTYDGTSQELGAGGLLAIAKDVHHEVETLEEGAFLLTIGWSARTPA